MRETATRLTKGHAAMVIAMEEVAEIAHSQGITAIVSDLSLQQL